MNFQWAEWGKMKVRIKFVFLLISAALCLCVVSLLYVAFDWPSFPELDSTLAAWVQAVGSVAAIFIAIAIAHRDSSLRREAELDARNGALVRALAVVSDAEERVKAAFDAAHKFRANSKLISSVTPHLEQCRQYLTEALSVHGLDSDIYTELFLARKSVEEVALVLPGIGHAETVNTESALLESLQRVNENLTQMQRVQGQ
jgi:hypothetical protein